MTAHRHTLLTNDEPLKAMSEGQTLVVVKVCPLKLALRESCLRRGSGG